MRFIISGPMEYFWILMYYHPPLKSMKYDKHINQPYLTNNLFNKKEIKLLILLRSWCHPAKLDLEKFNLSCSLNCIEKETQEHVFKNGEEIIENIKSNTNTSLENILGTVKDQ